MNEPPMPNTPVEYRSVAPYMITFEWHDLGVIQPYWVTTLDDAVLVFYDPVRPFSMLGTCDRRVLVDGRGVVIHGYSEAFVQPKMTITGEVSTVIARLVPNVTDTVFEMELEMLWQQS